MVALLRELRRERNGAVADSMRYYGTPYGLNYGVSLPTLRRIARAEAPDHGFARYLYRQDVRELRLAALHIACPACFTPEEFPAWAAGIVNSEIAEEAAFALLSLTASWVAPAVEAVHRNATAEATVETPAEATTEATAAAISAAADTSVAPGAFVFDTSVTEASSPEVATLAPGNSSVDVTPSAATAPSAAIVSAAPGASPASDPHVASPCAAGQQVSCRPAAQHPVPAARLTAQGAVALLAAVAAQNEENRQAVLRAAGSLGKLPAEDYVHEELAWRLEA